MPAIIYECHEEIDETSVSNQTDTQPAENTTIAESVDFFSKRTITKALKPKPKKNCTTFQSLWKSTSRDEHQNPHKYG